MNFNETLEKLNNMSSDELEQTIKQAMIKSGIEVANKPCRFVWEELKVEDYEIDVDKV